MKYDEMNNQPKNTVKKLQLKKETIRVLQDSELKQVAGGNTSPQDGCPIFETYTCPGFCRTKFDCTAGCSGTF